MKNSTQASFLQKKLLRGKKMTPDRIWGKKNPKTKNSEKNLSDKQQTKKLDLKKLSGGLGRRVKGCETDGKNACSIACKMERSGLQVGAGSE